MSCWYSFTSRNLFGAMVQLDLASQMILVSSKKLSDLSIWGFERRLLEMGSTTLKLLSSVQRMTSILQRLESSRTEPWLDTRSTMDCSRTSIYWRKSFVTSLEQKKTAMTLFHFIGCISTLSQFLCRPSWTTEASHCLMHIHNSWFYWYDVIYCIVASWYCC